MSAIRNTCVARGSMPAGTSGFVYTVPQGYVLLLKSVYTRPQGTGTAGIQVYAFSADSTTSVIVYDVIDSAANLAPWEGWLALNSGDQVYVGAPNAAMWYWISGALLPFASALPAGAIPGTP